jgi:hypothetical protein
VRFGALSSALMAGLLTSGAIALLPQRTQSQTAGPPPRSAAAFERVAGVLTGPRCQNCHTLTNFPRQGDERHPHVFNVMRGPADHGAPGLPCSTCHGKSNNPASGVPGADEEWRLAPIDMGWEGLSASELCRHLKDPQHNGGRTDAQIIDHLKSDLVRWAWSPGVDRHGIARTRPSISYAEFVEAAESWVQTGATCP